MKKLYIVIYYFRNIFNSIIKQDIIRTKTAVMLKMMKIGKNLNIIFDAYTCTQTLNEVRKMYAVIQM